MRRVTESQRDRILARVEVNAAGCWVWKGALFGNGYARLYVPGSPTRRSDPAHRVAYTEWRGPIPAGLQLDHLCHTRDRSCPGGRACAHRICVNPDHLEPVTVAENLHRSPHTIASRQRRHDESRCNNGHQLDGTNLRIDKRGRRVCRACAREAVNRFRARKQAHQ
jgi:hypothetical protein